MDPVSFARLAGFAKLNPCPSLALQFQARVARLRADATCLEGLKEPLDPPQDLMNTASRTRPDEAEQPLLQDEVLQGAAEIRQGMVALPRMTVS